MFNSNVSEHFASVAHIFAPKICEKCPDKSHKHVMLDFFQYILQSTKLLIRNPTRNTALCNAEICERETERKHGNTASLLHSN